MATAQLQKLTEIVEAHHGVKFTRARPNWLVNPENGCRMELDLYNKEIGVAYSLYCRHHYEYHPIFHKDPEGFGNLLARDIIRKDLCEKNGVKFTVVPYFCNTVEEMKKLIEK